MTSALNLPLASASGRLPALFQTVPDEGRRFWEFFTVNIRNPHTRRSYFKAVETFAAWCAERGLHDLAAVTPGRLRRSLPCPPQCRRPSH